MAEILWISNKKCIIFRKKKTVLKTGKNSYLIRQYFFHTRINILENTFKVKHYSRSVNKLCNIDKSLNVNSNYSNPFLNKKIPII